MSVRRRLERLECSGRPCPTCGIGPNSPVEYVVDFTVGEASNQERLPPCHECGREREAVIDWPDARPVPSVASRVPDYPPEGGHE